MKQYFIRVAGDKWTTEYKVSASNWATAVARGVKEWMKGQGKGSRTEKISVIAFKQNEIQEHSQICDRTIDCECKRCEQKREEIEGY